MIWHYTSYIVELKKPIPIQSNIFIYIPQNITYICQILYVMSGDFFRAIFFHYLRSDNVNRA